MDQDNDVSLPRSTLAQKIREAFPSELRVAGATMDLLVDCCTEFVQLVTSEANEISSKDNKATMNPEHILQALQQLEFPEFEADLVQLLEQFKQEAKGKLWLVFGSSRICLLGVLNTIPCCRYRQTEKRAQEKKR